MTAKYVCRLMANLRSPKPVFLVQIQAGVLWLFSSTVEQQVEALCEMVQHHQEPLRFGYRMSRRTRSIALSPNGKAAGFDPVTAGSNPASVSMAL